MEFITIVKVIGSIILLVLIISTIKQRHQKVNYCKHLRSAKQFDNSCQEGEYVQVCAPLAMPETKTYKSQRKCGYWAYLAWAQFESKKPKPHSGMQTHQPLLVKHCYNETPLMLDHPDKAVQLCFKDNLSLMVNLAGDLSTTKQPPTKEVEALQKDKYESYIEKEFWLKNQSELCVWGKISNINKQCVTLTGSRSAERPSVIYHGAAIDYLNSFKTSIFYNALSILIMSALLVSLWTWLTDFIPIVQIAFSAAFIIALIMSNAQAET